MLVSQLRLDHPLSSILPLATFIAVPSQTPSPQMAGPSNMATAITPLEEAYELRRRYTMQAAQMQYKCIADATRVDALQIPLDHQHVIHSYPQLLLAFGPYGAGTTREEQETMERVLLGPKGEGLPCKHWTGIDLRTMVSQIFSTTSTAAW